MRQITVSEAKTRWSRLLDEVQRGETLAITRDGRVIARLVPEALAQQEIDAAVDGMLALRAGRGGVTFEELKSARDEGRRY